jgi:hypothetical protein
MKHFLHQHISLMTNILKFIEFKESATLVFEYISQKIYIYVYPLKFQGPYLD